MPKYQLVLWEKIRTFLSFELQNFCYNSEMRLGRKNCIILAFTIFAIVYMYVFKHMDIFGLDPYDDGDVAYVAQMPLMILLVSALVFGAIFLYFSQISKRHKSYIIITLTFLTTLSLAYVGAVIYFTISILIPFFGYIIYEKTGKRMWVGILFISIFLYYIFTSYPIRDLVMREITGDPCYAESLQRGSGPNPVGPNCLNPLAYRVIDGAVCFQKIDKNNVCRWKIIKGADPETFVDLGNGVGKDKNTHWYRIDNL